MMNKHTAIYFFDTTEEFEETYTELENNPDFSYIGGFDMIEDIYEELEYQGLLEAEITQLTHNRYGNCLEILECPNNQYHAFIGAR